MRFSERIGKKQVRNSLQIEFIDKALANRIWNLILSTVFKRLEGLKPSDAQTVCRVIWTEFFGELGDETPRYSSTYSMTFKEVLKEEYFKFEWYEIYDLIEFLATLDVSLKCGFIAGCNNVLEREMSAYRLVSNKIVKTTSEEEISSMQEALDQTSKNTSVQTHLIRSLELLTNRESPDYRNSVKESISAVEALCVTITQDKKATLGNALKIIEKKHGVHSALKNAFSSLYGYTSDSGGIRHSLLEDDIGVTFEDAKFMLVSCSAFINYLKDKVDIKEL